MKKLLLLSIGQSGSIRLTAAADGLETRSGGCESKLTYFGRRKVFVSVVCFIIFSLLRINTICLSGGIPARDTCRQA